MKTVKHLLRNSTDPYLALLSYRGSYTITLLWSRLSMGHKIRTDLPQSQQNLLPEWSYIDEFAEKHKKFTADQKRHHDKRHRVQSLPILPEDQPVWVNTEGKQVPGIVLHQANAPRSYLLETPSGQVRRNRSHLQCRSESSPNPATQPVHMPNTRLRTGTTIRPPDRLTYKERCIV